MRADGGGVIDPFSEALQHGEGVWPRVQADAVARRDLHEGLQMLLFSWLRTGVKD